MELTREYFDKQLQKLATKESLSATREALKELATNTRGLATKEALTDLATKDALKDLATKDDLKELAKSEELIAVREELVDIKKWIKRIDVRDDEDTKALFKDLSALKKKVDTLEGRFKKIETKYA
jgi:DNA polymerase III delta prime subunit